jgi:hypothetical protein
MQPDTPSDLERRLIRMDERIDHIQTAMLVGVLVLVLTSTLVLWIKLGEIGDQLSVLTSQVSDITRAAGH